ncbi:hypothetical protein AB0M28_06325 [Streptomyces sp. NPDC051940]|uniref:hypothetical protein n=1 Tax=Streptomyces sp. NPDC051940 TaxID=3155675 RepID=UPI00342415D0
MAAQPAQAQGGGSCAPSDWQCLAKDAGAGDKIVIALDGPVTGEVTSARLKNLRAATLTVVLADTAATDEDGTKLLALADHRFVGDGSTVEQLSKANRKKVADAGGCTGDEAALCDRLTGDKTVKGDRLIDDGLAEDLFSDGSADSGSSSLWWALVGVAVLGLLLIAVLVLSTRRRPAVAGVGPAPDAPTLASSPRTPPAPPRPRGAHAAGRRPVPPGPRRGATVRTALHPQGYVELDGALFRAVWADSDHPAPEPGETVEVVGSPGTGLLTAVRFTS